MSGNRLTTHWSHDAQPVPTETFKILPSYMYMGGAWESRIIENLTISQQFLKKMMGEKGEYGFVK